MSAMTASRRFGMSFLPFGCCRGMCEIGREWLVLPITLDLVQTVAFAGAILFAGYGIRRVIPVLGKVNIPAPVCGGLPVAGLLAVLYFAGIQPIKFDTARSEERR